MEVKHQFLHAFSTSFRQGPRKGPYFFHRRTRIFGRLFENKLRLHIQMPYLEDRQSNRHLIIQCAIFRRFSALKNRG